MATLLAPVRAFTVSTQEARPWALVTLSPYESYA
ncbi:hypothetical protein J2S47_000053 [Streptomyces griseoviridis]|jgi:hypothetical protein|uniref:Uncharacterized protein n=1 Tax=Streptomyces griseoviridis TaxID=45398 RepID=A0ABT9LAJ3_STRGD|nr:hypothetical protein [Streptomyces griseoviridis]